MSSVFNLQKSIIYTRITCQVCFTVSTLAVSSGWVRGARPRRALVLEVANPPAVEALLIAAVAGACPCVDGRSASPAAVGVLFLLGPRAPACVEPFAVVVSGHAVDPGTDVSMISRGTESC